ncbi:MAG: glyceraldehyde dehydrogenase subunit alpha [Nitrososphaerota archaeon]
MRRTGYVGKGVIRKEDPRLITGRGRFIDDINLPRMLHLAFLRSPYAHARVVRVDLSGALQSGAVAAFTGSEINEMCGGIHLDSIPRGKVVVKPLAEGKVRYVGEPVALVLADDPYTARDAVEQINVEYERLPAVVDPLEASKPGAPVIHDEFPDNICFTTKRAYGDVDGAFAEADRVVDAHLRIQRLVPSAMETRGVVAAFDEGLGYLNIWAVNQFPFDFRSWTAEALGIPESKIRVISPDIGGAFGSKIAHYPEDIVVPLLAKMLKKPVKWIETRSENFYATTHGRGSSAWVQAAVKSDGRLLGVKARILTDLGAYPYFTTAQVPMGIIGMLPGCYKLRALEAEVTGVFTNKVPTGAYRGAGRPEASYIIERTVDRVARELGLDPAEVRRRNFIRPEEFPYRTITGNEYDSGNYELALNKALELAGYEEIRRRQSELRSGGKLLGVGISSYVEVCNFASTVAKVTVEKDGRVRVFSGTLPHGQGESTSFAQIAADALGVRIEDVDVIFGDTSLIGWGPGTAGSWTLASGGNSVLKASEVVRDKILRLAAHLMEIRPEDLEISEGKVSARGVPEKSLKLSEVAEVAYDPSRLPAGFEYGLSAEVSYTPRLTYPFGTHVAVVEVDSETGRVDVKKLVLVDDCGRVVNPLLVEGQLIGGAVQALAQALYEEAYFDSDGNLVTSNLGDYLFPTAVEIPEIITERTETPAPNPLGAKGVGEAATIGLTQAVVNAVEDALAQIGGRIENTPLTPFQTWSLIRLYGGEKC